MSHKKGGEKIMGELLKSLENYGNSNVYPFHMPGHKRQHAAGFDSYKIDITEVEGFDNLHHAEGILREAQCRAARLYHSEESHFLVNGSTGGILSAISACAGHTILMARNCHKAAYHAALIRKLDVYYLYPQMQEEFCLNGGIDPEDVKRELDIHPEIEAVIITSPTYDGIVSDVKSIAEIVHAYGKPLIVDEAHGAHFGFSDYFPENSVHLGADIVIHSLHKTLPAYTQTALLHVNGSLVNRERLRQFLQMYQTSSPSYILMAGIDECIRYVESQGKEAFEKFADRLTRMYQRAEELQAIRLVNEDIIGKNSIWDFDRSKLIFSVKNCGIAGNELQEILLHQYELELEIAAGTYALALTSLCDTDEGFQRLFYGIRSIDKQMGRFPSGAEEKNVYRKACSVKDCVTKNETCCSMDRAFESKKKNMLLAESEGQISGEFLYLYPPGIPMLVPGERIEKELLEKLENYRKLGFGFQGLEDFTGRRIAVVEIVWSENALPFRLTAER